VRPTPKKALWNTIPHSKYSEYFGPLCIAEAGKYLFWFINHTHRGQILGTARREVNLRTAQNRQLAGKHVVINRHLLAMAYFGGPRLRLVPSPQVLFGWKMRIAGESSTMGRKVLG